MGVNEHDMWKKKYNDADPEVSPQNSVAFQ